LCDGSIIGMSAWRNGNGVNNAMAKWRRNGMAIGESLAAYHSGSISIMAANQYQASSNVEMAK